MSSANKTRATEASVETFLESFPERVRVDCRRLIDIMRGISGCEPVLWGPSIIGFDSYHYRYASGRQGDACALGFAPRQGKLVVYLDNAARHAERIAALPLDPGVKVSTGKVCLYLPSLAGVDLTVLEQILSDSYAAARELDADASRAE